MNQTSKIVEKSKSNKRKLLFFFIGWGIFIVGLYLEDPVLIIPGLLLGGFGTGQLIAYW